ncbi:Gfo/Idh/MocA family protein [Lentzea sp. NPDC004789]
MRVAIVGCGYAADYYVMTMPNHPSLEIAGVYDRNFERQQQFTRYHGLAGYSSLQALLDDPGVEVVANITSPASHVEVTRAALMAGKHVYSEKPLALDLHEAISLKELAASKGLVLSSAPCNLLGPSIQTAWRAVRDGVIGTPRLVYAELDAGTILHDSPHKWVSNSGAPFPYEDEFSTGWTIVHAAYHLSWLTAVFGPVVHANAFNAGVKPVGEFLTNTAGLRTDSTAPLPPDFSVACLTFGSGVVARLTSSMAFARDQSCRIDGDAGTLLLEDSGHFGSRVTVTRPHDEPVVLPLLSDGVEPRCHEDYRGYDFARGIADLAAAAAGEDRSHLPVDHALHVLELTLSITNAGAGATIVPTTTFAPVPAP